MYGSYGARAPAKNASPSIARMISAPAAPSGFVRMNLTTSSAALSRGDRSAEAVACVSSKFVAMLAVPDPRVEPRVGQVDQQVHDHEAERRQEDQRLHDRVVPVGHRVHHEPAHAV